MMTRFRLVGTVLFIPVLTLALISAGCGGGDNKKAESGSGGSKSKAESSKKDESKGSTASAAGTTPIKATGFATVKGKATYDGTPPPPADIRIPDDNKDKEYCLKGSHTDPSWIVGGDKGVANVIVWVRAPSGKYFEIPADQQKPATPIVKIDQPFCAFEPHVAIAFPSYFDGKGQKETGQKLEIANSAKITHNTNWNPMRTNLDTGDNVLLEPGKAPRPIPLFEQPAAKKRANLEDLLTLKCNIHQWMTGYVWAFDHPYAAVTKQDGTYEIKVPAGTELHLVGWHEAGGYLGDGQKGQTIGPLKENETKTVDFKLKK